MACSRYQLRFNAGSYVRHFSQRSVSPAPRQTVKAPARNRKEASRKDVLQLYRALWRCSGRFFDSVGRSFLRTEIRKAFRTPPEEPLSTELSLGEVERMFKTRSSFVKRYQTRVYAPALVENYKCYAYRQSPAPPEPEVQALERLEDGHAELRRLVKANLGSQDELLRVLSQAYAQTNPTIKAFNEVSVESDSSADIADTSVLFQLQRDYLYGSRPPTARLDEQHPLMELLVRVGQGVPAQEKVAAVDFSTSASTSDQQLLFTKELIRASVHHRSQQTGISRRHSRLYKRLGLS